MDVNVDLQPVYSRHDLMIEIGRVQMAIELLAKRGQQEREPLRARLESHMHRLRDELERLAA